MRPLFLLLVLLALLLAFLQYKLWLGSGGQREGAALRAQVARQEAENLELQQRNGIVAVHPGGTADVQRVSMARRIGIGRAAPESAGKVE